MILLVASNKDVASLNIKQQILKTGNLDRKEETHYGNPVYSTSSGDREIKLVTLNQESVYAQNITENFLRLELVVFVSRHSSESGTPTLSVHTPGNLSEARLGGISNKVSIAPAKAMHEALKIISQLRHDKKLEYEVSYECTHHGPSLDVPTMFIELGSSPAQWKDEEAAQIIADTAMKIAAKLNHGATKAVLGIGGPHYNAKFTKISLDQGTAFGHIIPKYSIPFTNAKILKHCVERTMEEVACALIDWKGIKGEDKPGLIKALNEIDLPFEKV